MYNLIENSDICLKISGDLWEYDDAGSIIDFPTENNCSALFELKKSNRSRWH